MTLSTVILVAYLAVAAYIAGYAFYHGVWQQPRQRFVGAREYLLLTLVALLAGLFWILATPTLLVKVAHGRTAEIRPERRLRGWAAVRQAHVRS